MSGLNTSAELGGLIKKTLSPLMGEADYVFLDIPYYTNIGDTLIYKGTEDFLATLPGRCIYKTAIENYAKLSISEDVVILFQGGGNFGDIWRRHTDFVLRVLEDFPNNRAIILSQTIYYENSDVMEADARLMGNHPNLTICARDRVSYDLALKYFGANDVLMLPDMAFCIDPSFLEKYHMPAKEKALFFKRKDQEFADYDFDKHLEAQGQLDELEWPSMEQDLVISKILSHLKRINSLAIKVGFGPVSRRLLDWYAQTIYMPCLLKIGIRFISQYRQVYSTRLHGAILSILLNRPLVFFDNSYGKNSRFFDAWLTGFENVHFVRK